MKMYAVPGESTVVIDESAHPVLPEGHVEMKSRRPADAGYIANAAGEWVPDQSFFETAIQEHLDSTAQGMGYENIQTAISYADEGAVPKFQQEGKALRVWRSLVWAEAYEILGQVMSGQKPVPSLDQLISELPALEVS